MTRVIDLERGELEKIFLKIRNYAEELRGTQGGDLVLLTTDYLAMLPKGLRITLLSRLEELHCKKKQ